MKNNILKIKHLVLIIVFLFFYKNLLSQIPNGYYNTAEGKRGAELKTALYNIIKNPSFWNGKYMNAASFFGQYDRTPDGYIWDMYSNIRCTQWSGCGLNREHNMPKSWFGITTNNEDVASIGCDYNNLYPSNADANYAKNNYPLGEVGSSIIFDNGVSKVGKSKIQIKNGAYNGNVFEPANEYKGDFARDYMYMVTCYENYSQKWTNSYGMIMLQNNTYPTFTPYAIDLLLKWSKNDPVSQKEIDRNEAVYSVQGNRNPFVDHPEYAEYIWGDKAVTPESDKLFSVNYRGIDNVLVVTIDNESGAGALYEIYSISGQKIIENTVNQDGQISCAGLADGVYIVSIYSQKLKWKYTDKFFKYAVK
ncbi:MAG: endonuclease [Paludibacter sp.]|nr:endonuclease [Paludibacter sp.]